MKVQLIRNAALWLEYAGTSFLVDPMFSEQEANPPIPNTANARNNPLVPLPGPVQQWLSPDAVLVTHLHRDHWDTAAVSLLPHELPVLCQDGDGETLRRQGFEHVSVIGDNEISNFQNTTLKRTDGRHGTGEIGELMGKVSGFVFRAEGEPVLYIAGDTIWCDEVKQALDEHRPEVIIVNSGGAQFLNGGHITMNEQDIVDLCNYVPEAAVIAVHMEAINHCKVTREHLRARLEQEGLLDRVKIPGDGEWC
ncbi:MBL fold metallo-hydrolase [Paenibacillus sp. sgz5001063]|uniref:MBL fold metallo-hydrolase n=1 Tax=Paenibacillus sp. sgz5001063 TaxID=3242474 RepID=UPI0036D36D8C